MDVQERLESGPPQKAARLAWWHVVLVASAIVVALSSIVIAYAELRQADELRKANCFDRSQVSNAPSTPDVEAEFRRCLGI
jgi:hypothetical protein